jgi:hypothetical protein
MAKKQAAPHGKPQTHTAHPETQKPRPKSGTPGTESSKAQGNARDVRNRHDQDGNEEQARR